VVPHFAPSNSDRFRAVLKPILRQLAGLREPREQATFAEWTTPRDRRLGPPSLVKLARLVADPHLERAQHPCDRIFFLVDHGDVVQDDRPPLLAGLQNQPPGSQQKKLENIGNLLVDRR